MPTLLKNYRVQAGDTIQQIARREVGQADQWWVLVRLNDLAYPFIDSSGPSTTPRVLGLGDTLQIPGNALDPLIRQAAVPGNSGHYAILLGQDVVLNEQGDLAASKGSGDWQIQTGLPNLLQALSHRLLTRKGELAYHPEYGSNIWRHIGQPHDGIRQAMIRHEIRQTLLDDPRIASVIQMRVKEEFDHLNVEVQATIIGGDDVVPLNLVLQKAS